MAGAACALGMDRHSATLLAQRIADVLLLARDLDAEDYVRAVLARYRQVECLRLPPSSYDNAIAAAMANEWQRATA